MEDKLPTGVQVLHAIDRWASVQRELGTMTARRLIGPVDPDLVPRLEIDEHHARKEWTGVLRDRMGPTFDRDLGWSIVIYGHHHYMCGFSEGISHDRSTSADDSSWKRQRQEWESRVLLLFAESSR